MSAIKKTSRLVYRLGYADITHEIRLAVNKCSHAKEVIWLYIEMFV